MKNQVILSVPGTQRQAACPTTVKAGDPVLLGAIPAVAINDYESIYGGTTFEITGSYALTVIGHSSISPVADEAIGQGAKIYATGGTLDPTTDVTTGITLSATLPPAGIFFGTLDPQYQAGVAAGATDTAAWVRLGAI